MTLNEYEELAGVAVASGKRRLMEASLDRSQRILEALLGYTLDPDLVDQNLYTESGKTTSDFIGCCGSIDLDNLSAPDPVVGSYRLFPYNPNDKYLHIDPASTVHAVKLVYNDVTVKTFDEDEYRIDYGKDGWTRYLQRVRKWCDNPCTDVNVQLAIDADWLFPDEMPQVIQFIWADMVTFYGDSKKDLKSETIGQHSWTRFGDSQPERVDANISILQKHTGPHGTLTKQLVV